MKKYQEMLCLQLHCVEKFAGCIRAGNKGRESGQQWARKETPDGFPCLSTTQSENCGIGSENMKIEMISKKKLSTATKSPVAQTG